MDFLWHTETWLALASLTLLEVILGVDNLVVLAIASMRLPALQQAPARKIGLLFALVFRLLLLGAAVWIVGLVNPLCHVASHPISARDILFFLGGFFLLIKSVTEIIEMRHENSSPDEKKQGARFAIVILQIIFFDLVFSLDSIMTAVAMTEHYIIMAIAVTIAMLAMLLASTPLCHFVTAYPRVKVLALSFVLLIGVLLILESVHIAVPRSYLYVTMGFAVLVEAVNHWVSRPQKN